MSSIDCLAQGLLDQFTELQKLEQTLSQLLAKQNEVLESSMQKINLFENNQDIFEISIMVRKTF